MTTCRDCVLFPIEQVTDKAGRVLNHRAAQCQWKSVEVYPVSILDYQRREIKPCKVQANDGKGCKCFTPRGPMPRLYADD